MVRDSKIIPSVILAFLYTEFSESHGGHLCCKLKDGWERDLTWNKRTKGLINFFGAITALHYPYLFFTFLCPFLPFYGLLLRSKQVTGSVAFPAFLRKGSGQRSIDKTEQLSLFPLLGIGMKIKLSDTSAERKSVLSLPCSRCSYTVQYFAQLQQKQESSVKLYFGRIQVISSSTGRCAGCCPSIR